MRTALEIKTAIFISIAIYLFGSSLLIPNSDPILLDIATILMIVLSIFNVVADILFKYLKKTRYFSVSSIASLVWFSFIQFMDIYRLFPKSTDVFKIDFSTIITLLTLFILLAYLYSTLRKVFKMPTDIKIRPYTIIALSFAFVIFAGAILLFLPISRNAATEPITFLDAIFTATSAVCVTGLAVFDTGTRLSFFGQIVLLCLIQVGALGLITFVSFFSVLLGEKVTMSGGDTLKNALSYGNFMGIGKFISFIIKATIIIEIIGAILLFSSFIQTMPFEKALYYSIFHAISAFCNAGFSLFPDSLMGYRGDILVNLTVMSLIIIGGIGFTVITNVIARFKNREKLSLHSKLVITVSSLLIVVGAVVFFILEKDNLLLGLSIKDTILSSFFSSVTARTAGFNTLDFGMANNSTIVFFIILMFIGASPGSTGGGIKTTTLVVILLNTFNIIRDKLHVTVFRREVPFDIIRKATVIMILSFIWILFSQILLNAFESFSLSQLFFEGVSAFGTVGLSTGITPNLSVPSKIVIIMTMFLGRVGPATLMFSLGLKSANILVRRPEEKILVG